MKKAFIISMIITASEFIAAIVLFPYLPEQIPIHWNIAGAVDGSAGKEFIFALPVLSLVLTLLFHWAPRITPKGENIEKSGKIYPGLMVLLSLLMAALLTITAVTAFGISVPTTEIIFAILGILMLFIGNYMPKVKPNYVLGIRLPWTLSSEVVWVKTHRFSGWVFLVIGLLFLVGIFLPAPVNFILPLVGLFAGILAIVWFACISYKKNK
jgi:uncharacterized membrane protein